MNINGIIQWLQKHLIRRSQINISMNINRMIQWLQKHLVRKRSQKKKKKKEKRKRRRSQSNINMKFNGTRLTDLPDDMVTNILSRLPLRCIPNLQIVCKNWLALTSTPYFAETHFKSGVSSQISNSELDLFVFNKEAGRCKLVKIMSNGFVKMVSGGVSPILVGSCNGLLVFQIFLGSPFLVWDLVAREYTYIDAVPSQSHNFSLSAILFHPSSTSQERGYKLLFSSPIGKPEPGYRYEFFIYESRNKMWRKLSASSFYPPTNSIDQAVVVNPTVYKRCVFWLALCNVKGLVDNRPCRRSVVIFDMELEEFRSMPHPGSECKPMEYAHKHMYFFEVKGQLYFCHNCFESFVMWSLEGYDRWYWVKKHEFKLDGVSKSISSIYFPSETCGFNIVKFIKLEGDAIYFHCYYRGLFMYDWRKDIVKQLDMTRWDYYSGMNRVFKSAKFTYWDSLLSLESGFRCLKS